MKVASSGGGSGFPLPPSSPATLAATLNMSLPIFPSYVLKIKQVLAEENEKKVYKNISFFTYLSYVVTSNKWLSSREVEWSGDRELKYRALLNRTNSKQLNCTGWIGHGNH